MRNLPIIGTVSAAATSLGLAALVEMGRADAPWFESPLALALCFLAGLVYTQWIEYWYHRVPMHQGLHFLPVFEDIQRSHRDHHRIFHGERFQTRDEEALLHVAGRFWVFPVIFFLHYAILVAFLPAPFALVFMGAAAVHYIGFEVSHWFTHLADNPFDRAVARIPLLSGLRERHVSHHRWHHEYPDEAFNFMPPYLGDWLASGQGARAEKPRPLEPPEGLPAPADDAPSSPPKPWKPWMRPALRYGTVAAVGVVAVGLAVLAHGRFSSHALAEKAASDLPELSA